MVDTNWLERAVTVLTRGLSYLSTSTYLRNKAQVVKSNEEDFSNLTGNNWIVTDYPKSISVFLNPSTYQTAQLTLQLLISVLVARTHQTRSKHLD